MKTKSLCPFCLKLIDAETSKEKNKIYIEKTCVEHGKFKDIYWSDAKLYEKFKKYSFDGNGVNNPNISEKRPCPFDCGLCSEHKTTTILANIDLTNRCNQNCPVCFANASKSDYVYEPSLDEVRKMLKILASEKPVRTWSVQFSGGEPTIHPDFLRIVKIAKEMNFTHIQVATNGTTLANNPDFALEIKKSGINTIYLQFDGLKKETYEKIRGFDALGQKMKAIENCRKAKLSSIVLVPTLMKGINDDEIGDILRFAAKNKDVVRGINFQPVSFSGRIDKEELIKSRITIPDVLKSIERQTNNEIEISDFYPVPSVVPLSRYIEKWLNESQVELTIHPHCGAGAYVFIDKDKFIPLTRFINIDDFFDLLRKDLERSNKKNLSGAQKMKLAASFISKIPSLLGKKEKGKGSGIPLIITKTILNIIRKGKRDSLLEFHKHFIFLGIMHFQDPYNFDVKRVERCGIHYSTLDGRIIPFCAYNNLYREEIEKRFAKKTEK